MIRLWFNPRCGTARAVHSILSEAGIEFEVVNYLDDPPSRADIGGLLQRCDAPPSDLVRKDAHFRELGLEAADFTTVESVTELLAEHPRLLQRPLVETREKVMIARPPSRVEDWLRSATTTG